MADRNIKKPQLRKSSGYFRLCDASLDHHWMLRKAKTARLVITLYRHITDTSPTVGRLSVVCRPTDSLCFGENLLADRRPTDCRQTANSQPTVGQQMADSRPRPTVGHGQQSANRFFGELFFTITKYLVSRTFSGVNSIDI